ncbi:hypothetical protein N9129_02315 [Akkermansiaceae bacterium]|nr:hypothetical protein [Akkermansiaceae bacterium]
MKLATIILLGITSLFASAEEPTVLSQKEVGEQACGPCAFINSLLFSNDQKALAKLRGDTPEEKATHFIERYGSTRSIFWKSDRNAYSEDTGINAPDLISLINSFRRRQNQSDIKGQLLVRGGNENSAQFIDRIHGVISKSITAGFPPLLDIRSTVAKRADLSEKILWHTINAHWVCIISATKVESDNPVLLLRIADSASGKIIGSLMCNAPPRGAKVAIRTRIDGFGKEKTTWIGSSQCLFLEAPGMPLGTQKAKWHERTYLNARYLLWCPSKKEASQ